MNNSALDLLDVSLTRGGIFYQLQERLRIVNANDRPIVVRSAVFALIAFVPLVALAAIQGLALNEDTHRSLLLDFNVYARLLVAVPIFILAENTIDDRYVIMTSYFRNSGIVEEADIGRYQAMLESTQRLLFSRLAEAILLIIAYLGSLISLSWDLRADVVSWRTNAGSGVTFAGAWFFFISLPLFFFLIVRWAWRFLIWAIFLWRLATLKLHLVATHPDGVGGLGVLAESTNAVSPIIFGLSATIASAWGNHLLYGGHKLSEYQMPCVAIVVGAVGLAVFPVIVFTSRLLRLKLHGLHDYGVLANRHSLFFDEKWVLHARENMHELLGTQDVSSLADLGAGYQTVAGIRFVPVRLRNIMAVVVAVVIPMLPLLLIEFPLQELLIKIGGALL